MNLDPGASSRPSTRQSMREKLDDTRRSGRFSPYVDVPPLTPPDRQRRYDFKGTLPRSISEARTSGKLLLASHALTKIPAEAVESVGALSMIDLSGNDFKDLPDLHLHTESLEVLYLHRNKLTSIPDPIGGFLLLQELYLSFNYVKTISPLIAELRYLRVLMLNNNEISFLPSEIGQLAQLEQLDLSFNKIVSIPQSYGNLSNLRRLQLSSNQLLSLPQELGYLQALEQLKVDNNPIVVPSPEICAQGLDAILVALRYLIPPETDGKACYAEGNALQGGVVEELNMFRVYAVDQFGLQRTAGMDNFVLHITGPSDNTHIEGRDNDDGTHDFAYSSTVAGTYTMQITLDDVVEISGSPFTLVLTPGPTCAARCIASGSGCSEAVVNRRAKFIVQARDKFQNDRTTGGDLFQVHLCSDVCAVEGQSSSAGNGRYSISYVVPRPGLYQMSVKLGDEHINGSPFVVNVISGEPPPTRAVIPLEQRAREALQSRVQRPPTRDGLAPHDTRLMKTLGGTSLRGTADSRPPSRSGPDLPRIYLQRMQTARTNTSALYTTRTRDPVALQETPFPSP